MPRSSQRREACCPCHQPQGLLTYAEAGEVFRVHPKTVRDWADLGMLVKVELGPHTLRVTRWSVDALITEGRAKAAER